MHSTHHNAHHNASRSRRENRPTTGLTIGTTALAIVATLFATSTAQAYHEDHRLGVFELGMIGVAPSGEYDDSVNDFGFGIDALLAGQVTDTVQLGLQFGWSRFDSAPLDLGHRTAQVSDNTFSGHIVLRVQPRFGALRPYVEGLVGTKALVSTDNGSGATSFPGSDWTSSFGLGAGVGVKLFGGDGGPEFGLTAGVRHLWGGDATYLVVKDRFPDPTFEVRRSRTDSWQPRVGLTLSF